MSYLRLFRLTLAASRGRFLLLGGFAAVLLGTALTARLLSAGADHAELDRIFEIGGPTLGAAFLVFGWLVGRFPLIATFVLLAGVFSEDRATGTARVLTARPRSVVGLYAAKLALLSVLAFAFSAVLLPVFDITLLGRWGGPTTLVLAAAYVIAYSAVIALLSVFTRADAWIALLLLIVATTWYGLRAAGMLDAVPPGGRQFVSQILPPHGSLLAIEAAFGRMEPVPWDAFLDVCIYAATLLVVAALLLRRREL